MTNRLKLEEQVEKLTLDIRSLNLIVVGMRDVLHKYVMNEVNSQIDKVALGATAPTPPSAEPVAWTTEFYLKLLRESPREVAAVWGEPNGVINKSLYAAPTPPSASSGDEKRYSPKEVAELIIKNSAVAYEDGRRSASSGNGELSLAATDVLAERQRQVSVEGWTSEHDDTHDRGEIAAAAGSYAVVASFPDASRTLWTGRNRNGEQTPWPNWPWSPSWWKPKSRRHDLVRAGALILAEIERLDRIAPSGEQIDKVALGATATQPPPTKLYRVYSPHGVPVTSVEYTAPVLKGICAVTMDKCVVFTGEDEVDWNGVQPVNWNHNMHETIFVDNNGNRWAWDQLVLEEKTSD